MKDKTCERSTRSGFPLPSTAVVPCATFALSDQLRSSSKSESGYVTWGGLPSNV